MKTDKEKNQSEFLLNPLAKWSQAITLTLVSLASFGFLFAFFAKIEEVVIARGDLESSIPIQNIFPPVGGYISEVLVKEGQIINANQPLIIIESDLTLKNKKTLQDQIKNEVKKKAAELNILVLTKESLLESKRNQEVILPNLDNLVEQGAISKLDYFEKKENYFNTINQIKQKESEIEKLNNESFKVISGYKKELDQINKTLSYKNIKSTIKGKVFDLRTINPGLLVRENENEPIMKIVPMDSLIAKIFISNKDIGFIKKGQQAKIRIDSYPFTEFGEIEGVLESIADEVVFPDSQTNIPHYPATIKLNKQFLEKSDQKYPLISGQTVQANLITRNKRVISLFTDVINKSIDSLRSIRSKKI